MYAQVQKGVEQMIEDYLFLLTLCNVGVLLLIWIYFRADKESQRGLK